MKMIEHIKEMKWRIIYIIIGVIITSLIVLENQVKLTRLLSDQYREINMIYTEPTEAIRMYIYLSIIIGIISNIPIIIQQIYWYVRPGLYEKEEKEWRANKRIIMVGCVLWFIILNKEIVPNIIEYLRIFESDHLEFKPKLNELIKFYIWINIISMVLLSMPSIIRGLGIIEWGEQRREYIIIGSLVIGGLITPPDIISQIMVGMVIIIMIEWTIIKDKWRKNKKKEEKKGE